MPRRASPKRALLAWVISLALLAPLASFAQDDAVQRYLTAAARLYENLEYERAIAQLERAKTLPNRTVDDDVAIALYEGIILADMGKKDQSIAAFKEGLFLKPDAKLPVRVSPKVVSDFESVRREVKKELAPILAKQEAERKRKEEEARKAAEAQKKLDEQNAKAAAEAKKRADAADKARLDAEAKARRTEDDKARSDRPENDGARILTVRPDLEQPANRDFVPGAEKKVDRGMPVAPLVLGGIALAAGGSGAFLGIQSRGQVEQARAAGFQDETIRALDPARSNALLANIAFGVAGAAAISAIVSLFIGGGDDTPAPRTESDGAGAGFAE